MKGFDAAERAAAAIYDKKTGAGTDALRAMMERELWMTGSEAVDKGFADTILDGPGPEMKLIGDEILMVNGVEHNIRGLHIPPSMHIPTLSHSILVNKQTNQKEETQLENTGTKNTTLSQTPSIQTTADLEREYPALVAQLKNDAAQAE